MKSSNLPELPMLKNFIEEPVHRKDLLNVFNGLCSIRMPADYDTSLYHAGVLPLKRLYWVKRMEFFEET